MAKAENGNGAAKRLRKIDQICGSKIVSIVRQIPDWNEEQQGPREIYIYRYKGHCFSTRRRYSAKEI